MNKKIVFFNTNFAWGGGEKWHFTMATKLKAHGHETIVIGSINSKLVEKSKEEGIKTIEVAVKHYSFLNPFKRMRIKKILSEISPQAIFFNSPQDIKLAAGISHDLNIPVKVYRRGMPHPIKNTIFNRKLYTYIDTIIANSLEIKRSITKYMPELEAKTTIVYNGVTPKELTPKKVKSPIILGNLARLVEQKGHSKLIEVARILNNKGLDFQMLIAGDGPLKESLESMITKYGLSDKVKLIGHVESVSFFEKVDLFVFTSYFEGSANALIESLQHGTPAVAFDISSNSEVVKNAHEGFLITPFDCNDMAEKIIQLTQSPELYSEFQKNCHKKVIDNFDINKKVSDVISIIEGT